MKRRTLLRGLAAAGTLTLTAGCLADGSPGDQPTDTDEPTDTDDPTDTPMPTDDETPTDTSTPTDAGDHVDTVSGTDRDPEPSDTPGVTDSSFSVTGSGCGSQTDDASVSFDDGAGTVSVSVSGTIWGNDACYTARLADTTYESDTLTVVVASESDAGTDTMCAECITEVDYEATVTFDGALPGKVEVKHRHGDDTSTVTTADN